MAAQSGQKFQILPGKKGRHENIFNNLKKSIQIKNDSIGKNINLIKEFCEMIIYLILFSKICFRIAFFAEL
jgi:hypothetical protein